MATGSLLPVSPIGDSKSFAGNNHSLPGADLLTDIIRRSTGNQSEAPSQLDVKRLVARAMEIDTEHSVSPLSEGQWDYGLDMLARAEAPAETGLAVRQERIVVALSKALEELKSEKLQNAS